MSAGERERRLFPELTIYCYEIYPLHGGRDGVATGSSVFIPPSFDGSGGPGGMGADYGRGDPTESPRSGGCIEALLGTEGPDRLTGSDDGDVVFGLGGRDRMGGRGGHDCLLGGEGNDELRGEQGSDRLTGGRGEDVLVGGPGVNAYDAGPGSDDIQRPQRQARAGALRAWARPGAHRQSRPRPQLRAC